jgi:predicted Zn-dependent peptidase
MIDAVLPSQTLYRFDNGLRLLVDPIPGQKTFTLTAVVHGGARFETEAQSGWAHLLEHMVFKGAGPRNTRELAEAIEHKGGNLNASTGYEHTRFEARGLSTLLPLAGEIVADMMYRPVLDAAELNREKKVVEQEMLEAYDTPDDHVFDLLQSAMFAGQALGRPILGSKASLKPVTPDALRAFAASLYAPSRTVVCISGGITAEDALAAARGRFDAAPEPATLIESEPAHFTAQTHTQKRRIEQANIALAWQAPGRLSPDNIPLKLFSEILGGGMASRLFQQAREERGLAYDIDSWATTYRDIGVLGISAGCAAKDVAELTTLAHDVLAGLAADPKPEELERAKAQYLTGLAFNFQDSEWRSSAFASQLSSFDRVFSFDDETAEVEAVALDDLRRVGAAITAQPQPAKALLGPLKAS